MFFDAAAVAQICARRLADGVLSRSVLDEAERNVTWKVRGGTPGSLHALIADANMRTVPTPAIEPLDFPFINEKDRHVYAVALLAGADYVITHDRALIAEINAQGDVRALTPGDFLQQIMPMLLQKDA